jgi:hypothetical protein
MRAYLKKNKFFAYLKRRGWVKTAAFIQSLPDLLVALGAGYGAYKIETVTTMDGVNKALKFILFVSVTVWWMIRFYENYEKVTKRT